jgi:hypothetical protein
MRDEGHRHDPQLARVCWGLVLDLFDRRLCSERPHAVAMDKSGC